MTIHTPLLDTAMWVRGLPGRITGTERPPPPRLVPAEQTGALPGWVMLGEQPGRELTFGAVGAGGPAPASRPRAGFVALSRLSRS